MTPAHHDSRRRLGQEIDRHARIATPSIRDDGRARVLRAETTSRKYCASRARIELARSNTRPSDAGGRERKGILEGDTPRQIASSCASSNCCRLGHPKSR